MNFPDFSNDGTRSPRTRFAAAFGRGLVVLSWAAFACGIAGCSGAAVGDQPVANVAGGGGSSGGAGASAGGSGAAGAAPSLPRQPDPSCVAPAGVSNSPHTITETVALVNAMQKPLSLPCFLEALARPLEINATFSVFSAQPAQGRRSPRIFLFLDPDIMSIVPDGDGAPLLEFGQEQPDYRSLKGQITFPVLAALTPAAPFADLLFNDQLSTCGVCHANEEQDSTISGVHAFISESLRPRLADQVGADELRQQLAICDRATEPDRCAMLDGLLGWGAVTDRAFPSQMDTFGGGQ